VEEAGAGICFEPENARALANAVLTMAANQTLRESCGRRGRRFIIERLSRKKTAQEYVKLLENLVSPAVAKSSAA